MQTNPFQTKPTKGPTIQPWSKTSLCTLGLPSRGNPSGPGCLASRCPIKVNPNNKAATKTRIAMHFLWVGASHQCVSTQYLPPWCGLGFGSSKQVQQFINKSWCFTVWGQCCFSWKTLKKAPHVFVAFDSVLLALKSTNNFQYFMNLLCWILADTSTTSTSWVRPRVLRELLRSFQVSAGPVIPTSCVAPEMLMMRNSDILTPTMSCRCCLSSCMRHGHSHTCV